MKIRTLIGGAALVAMALACGGGEVEDISIDVPTAVDAPAASASSGEKADVEALCVAITESGETDAETDAALADAKVTTDKGKALAVSLQEGDVLPDAPMDELIDWIRATGAQESSLDCALIEGLWSLGE